MSDNITIDDIIEQCREIGRQYRRVQWWIVKAKLRRNGVKNHDWDEVVRRIFDADDFKAVPCWNCMNESDWGEECGHRNFIPDARPRFVGGLHVGFSFPPDDADGEDSVECDRCGDRSRLDEDGIGLSWGFDLVYLKHGEEKPTPKLKPPRTHIPVRVEVLAIIRAALAPGATNDARAAALVAVDALQQEKTQ